MEIFYCKQSFKRMLPGCGGGAGCAGANSKHSVGEDQLKKFSPLLAKQGIAVENNGGGGLNFRLTEKGNQILPTLVGFWENLGGFLFGRKYEGWDVNDDWKAYQ